VTGSVVLISSDVAACEGGDVVWTDNLLMKGISDKEVKNYVDEILANGECNLNWVPDNIERVIFESTVRLTLNVVYHWISYWNGIKFWEHLSLEMKESVDSPDPDSPGVCVCVCVFWGVFHRILQEVNSLLSMVGTYLLLSLLHGGPEVRKSRDLRTSGPLCVPKCTVISER